MSATSSIMVCPRVRLRALPDAERDVLRRLVTEYVVGADADNQREWLRLWRDLTNAEPGECEHLHRAEARDTEFHARHRAILARLLANVEGFTNEDALHDFLKLKCWHVDWKNGKPTPASTNFDECSEARIRKFNRRLQDLLHTPAIQRQFWPHIPAAQRHEMVELVLTNPKEKGA